MNINCLTNHLCFEHIFKNYLKDDGTYDWFNISKEKDLPSSFIDKYFFQIYIYGNLERNNNLSNFIINKYRKLFKLEYFIIKSTNK